MLVEQSPALRAAPASGGYLSPSALAATKDGKILFIACATANRILRLDTTSQSVLGSMPVSRSPLGLSLSADDTRLYVTRAGPQGTVCIVEAASSTLMASMPAGHTSLAPVLTLDGKTLYVCNRFHNNVSVLDLAARKEVRRIAVQREPVAADLTQDGKFLLVANHLRAGRADVEDAPAVVSVIDIAAGRVVKELRLPSGSGVLNDVRVSPDGKYAAVTHLVAAFNRAASQVRFGWMNANALTLIDLGRMEIRYTLLLDEPGSGAANPSGLAWSPDGTTLVVGHAGTHEVSVIDFPALLAGIPQAECDRPFRQEGSGNKRLDAGVQTAVRASKPVLAFITRYEGLAEGLPFLVGARQRVKLPPGDLGPRAVVLVGTTAYTANYFSDTLTAIELSDPNAKPQSIPLGTNHWAVAQISKSAVSPTSKSARDRSIPGASGLAGPAGLESRDTAGSETCATDMPLARRGEFCFHDASICEEGWQSCASCHPGDARADGLNWDLLNDGIGNPKNTKSLLFSHQTSPAMWLSVRETAETAVRAGLKHILFTEQPAEVATAIDAYLKSLEPVPSPHLVNGRLSEAARRGERIFSQAGCGECHPPPLFTDLRQYDVGTRRGFDRPADKFDTPALVELWRTAPYLHDGSAATVRDVLTTRNPRDQHGTTSNLSTEELNDLCAYLLSL